MPQRGQSQEMQRGRGMGGGGGKGRMGGLHAHAGPTGYCVCPKCNEKTAHQQGIPCFSVMCHKCGSQILRE